MCRPGVRQRHHDRVSRCGSNGPYRRRQSSAVNTRSQVLQMATRSHPVSRWLRGSISTNRIGFLQRGQRNRLDSRLALIACPCHVSREDGCSHDTSGCRARSKGTGLDAGGGALPRTATRQDSPEDEAGPGRTSVRGRNGPWRSRHSSSLNIRWQSGQTAVNLNQLVLGSQSTPIAKTMMRRQWGQKNRGSDRQVRIEALPESP
jgi:hypothetical protein